MRIIAEEKIENCFEHEFVFKYVFDAKWTKETIKAMEALGKLRYYESFPKPMFHLTFLDSTIVKGVQDTDECRVTFPRVGTTEAKKRFEKIFNSHGGLRWGQK